MYFVDFKKCKITDRIAGQHASIDWKQISIKICISCLSLSFAFQGMFVGGNIEITWNGTLEGHGLWIQVTEQNKFSSEYSVISHIWKHKIMYKTIILLVFLLPLLYGYETYFLSQREHRFGMLRRLLGPKTEVVRGGWQKLHSENSHILCCLSYIISVISARRLGGWGK
jgi:hypothetical protein